MVGFHCSILLGMVKTLLSSPNLENLLCEFKLQLFIYTSSSVIYFFSKKDYGLLSMSLCTAPIPCSMGLLWVGQNIFNQVPIDIKPAVFY